MNINQIDVARLFNGPGLLKVYVPPHSPERPEDFKRDFPPWKPPKCNTTVCPLTIGKYYRRERCPITTVLSDSMLKKWIG